MSSVTLKGIKSMHYIQGSAVLYYLRMFTGLIRISVLLWWEIEAPLSTALTPGASNRDNTVDQTSMHDFLHKFFDCQDAHNV